MAVKEKIRIRIKGYDHQLVDQAAGKIVGLMGCAVKRMGEDVFKRLPKLDFAVGPRMFGMIPRIVASLGENRQRLFPFSYKI